MDSAEIREPRQSDDTRGLEPVQRGRTIKWTGIDSDTLDLIIIVMEPTVNSFNENKKILH